MACILLFSFSCGKDGGVNIFTLEDDKVLGEQLAQEIANDPATYPVLSEALYPEAYAYLYEIRDSILNSSFVNHKNDFKWETKIIANDSVLNEFAGPAGYIYVYTGLIKYLDSEDEFVGVMGHEIAHADRRHVPDNLTQIYGIQLLLGILLGTENDNQLAGIAAGLAGLSFSRAKEKEADEFSVRYLCNSRWNASGAAGFFEKLGNASPVPAFLSTHPAPEKRVENINGWEEEFGCPEGGTFENRYAQFKASLP